MTIKTGPIMANRYRVTGLIKFMRESHQATQTARFGRHAGWPSRSSRRRSNGSTPPTNC